VLSTAFAESALLKEKRKEKRSMTRLVEISRENDNQRAVAMASPIQSVPRNARHAEIFSC
jgi:hypothetical protein